MLSFTLVPVAGGVFCAPASNVRGEVAERLKAAVC
jgi:hypothetical protein